MKKPYLIAICLLVLIIGVALTRRSKPADAAVSDPGPQRPSPLDEQIRRPPVLVATETVRTRVAEAQKEAAPPMRELGGSDWAVVAAIYREYEPAERRARAISESSTFKATVFPRKGEGSKYMVVLDSGLTQGKAQQARELAASNGLPPDTYVTRLSAR